MADAAARRAAGAAAVTAPAAGERTDMLRRMARIHIELLRRGCESLDELVRRAASRARPSVACGPGPTSRHGR